MMRVMDHAKTAAMTNVMVVVKDFVMAVVVVTVPVILNATMSVMLFVKLYAADIVARIAPKHVIILVKENVKALVKRYVTQLVVAAHVKAYVLPIAMINARRHAMKRVQKVVPNNAKTSVVEDVKKIVDQNVGIAVLLSVKWIVLVIVKPVVALIALVDAKMDVNQGVKGHVCSHVKEAVNLNVMDVLVVVQHVMQPAVHHVLMLLQFIQFRKLKKNNHPNYNVNFNIKEKSLCHTIISKQLFQKSFIIN